MKYELRFNSYGVRSVKGKGYALFGVIEQKGSNFWYLYKTFKIGPRGEYFSTKEKAYEYASKNMKWLNNLISIIQKGSHELEP